MRTDPKVMQDGYSIVSGGIDSRTPPQLLPRTTFAWSANLTYRNNTPSTRPGWVQRPLAFSANASVYLDTTQASPLTEAQQRSLFEDGIFQGAIGFERMEQIVVSIGGHLFAIDPSSWYVTDTTPTERRSTAFGLHNVFTGVNTQLSRAWLCEAEQFVIRQDGQSQAWIYDGSSTRAADSGGVHGTKEVPGGKAMCYSQGRLIVTLADERSFVIGDIVGGPSGTAKYSFSDAVLKFTENDIITLGGSFTVPINAGHITAIRPVAQVDTSLGQGPTQIFTTSAIFSLNTPSNREAWKSVTYPIQTFSVVQAGSASDRSTIVVNGDIWTRSLDGVRSFQVARRDFGSWTNTPQSQEMVRATKWDDTNLLSYSSAALFDNRLFITSRPYVSQGHGVAHRGLMVVDFAPVSTLAVPARPVWEGIWSGLQVLQVFSCTFGQTQRCFLFALSPEDKIELWEMTQDAYADQPAVPAAQVPIEWMAETSGYSWPDLGYDEKKIAKAWFWPDDIRGSCSVALQFRSNGSPSWTTWSGWSFCSTMRLCGNDDCSTPAAYQPQTRRPYILPEANSTCDSATQAPVNIGEWFQVRLIGTGSLRLSRLMLSAREVEQAVNQQCPATESCRTVNNCPIDGFDYSAYG